MEKNVLFGAVSPQRQKNQCPEEEGEFFLKASFSPYTRMRGSFTIPAFFQGEKKIPTAMLSMSGNLYFDKRTKYS